MSDERSRVNCTITEEELAKIEELADRMGVSPSRMASMLLQAGLEDNATIIRLVSSSFGKKITAAVRGLSEKKRKPRTT